MHKNVNAINNLALSPDNRHHGLVTHVQELTTRTKWCNYTDVNQEINKRDKSPKKWKTNHQGNKATFFIKSYRYM